MEKLHIDRLIVVEGKYDKIRLENIVDAPIAVINGFHIFNDGEMLKTLRTLSKNGVIILTDSDRAGYRLRVYLSEVLSGCDITDVFIPQLEGKEPRKEKCSADGFLGVEGVPDSVLRSTLERFCRKKKQIGGGITVAQLYELGYTGCEGARDKKNRLLRYLGVQTDISNRFLLRILNDRFTENEFADLKLGGK